MTSRANILTLVVFVGSVRSHGIFWEPPSRASLGKHGGNMCEVAVDNDHMSLFCGGAGVQHNQHGGRCAICGDEFGAPHRPHEAPGGQFATGIIGRSYFQPGQVDQFTINETFISASLRSLKWL